jgi:tRNA pseudouridine38-40 synthase
MFAASRTDAGVHARGQLAKLECAEIENELSFLYKLNSSLPRDIHVINLARVSSDFNPIKSTSKVYEYFFSTAEYNPIFADCIYYHHGKLDLELMQLEASKLIGQHDFQKYSTKIYPNSVREIFSASIESVMLGSEKVNVFRIEGNGFLKYMVRRIMQELFNVGAAKSSFDKLGKASAAGLTLVLVKP